MTDHDKPTLEDIAGSPAFPNLDQDGDGHGGMTLLQYYAAHAPITMADAVQALPGRCLTTAEKIEMLAKLRLSYARAMVEAHTSAGDKG